MDDTSSPARPAAAGEAARPAGTPHGPPVTGTNLPAGSEAAPGSPPGEWAPINPPRGGPAAAALPASTPPVAELTAPTLTATAAAGHATPSQPSTRGIGVARLYRRAAFLALLRDPLHSWVVPFLLLLPFSILDALLPEPREVLLDPQLLGLSIAGGLLGLITTLLISAMLRVRCFADASGQRVHGLDAYARGVERLPVLLVTEIVRTLAIGAAALFFVIPGVVLSQRLSVATEGVVLGEPSLADGFQQSFDLTRGRFGAWLRMVIATVAALCFVLVGASLVYAVVDAFGHELAASLAVAPFAAACLAVVQYAWAGYYLELGGAVKGLSMPDRGETVRAPGAPATLSHPAASAAGVPAEPSSPQAPEVGR